MAMRWMRKAAENGLADGCFQLAGRMDRPYAREVGHVGKAARATTSAVVMEGHDVPPDVLTSVIWLQNGGGNPSDELLDFADKHWRGLTIAATTGARLLTI